MAEEQACTLLTKGRKLDCNRIAGGVKNVYFAVYDTTIVTQDWDSSSASRGQTTDVDMGSTSLYKYALPRGTASFTDTLVGSRENGTVYYTPTIQILLDRITPLMQNEMRLLGATTTVIFAELNQTYPSNDHNVIVVLGGLNGMQLNAGTDASGAAWGDRNGYDLTFDGIENHPASILLDYTNTPFDNTDSGAQIPIIDV
tara:strand:- start:2188 stop:2787 length:600 start_codon:yes stop_codon:yes gene_type:complete